MMGPISEQRLSQVHPVLSALIHKLAAMMSEPIGVTQGLRTDAEQEAYFAQGRQSLATVNVLRSNVNLAAITAEENEKPVTNAPPGYSWHAFGLAVDLVPESVTTGQPDWDEMHPVWEEIVQKGESLGMTSGIEWHDMPHLQLTGIFPVTPSNEVREIFASGGLQAVWQAAKINIPGVTL
jgi:D-alanyl-D-alanine carboxypeptidase